MWLCCSKYKKSTQDLNEEVENENEPVWDSEATTSSTSLLNSFIEVLWPTLVAPLIMNLLTKAPLDLGEDAKGYQLICKKGTLTNLRIDFTHVGVVTKATAILKPYYERSLRSWTPYDIRQWLCAGESKNHARWDEIGTMMEQNNFNGVSLLATTAQELQEDFNLTLEETNDIIQSRNELKFSMSDMAELIGKLQLGCTPALGSCTNADANETKGNEKPRLCSVITMDVEINLSGAPEMEFLLENEENLLLPNVGADISTLDLNAKLRLEVDPTNEEIRLGFFERPQLELKLDINLTKIHIPLFGESRWLDEIFELVLERFTPMKPIKIPLIVDIPSRGDSMKTKLSVRNFRSVRRAF